MKLARIVGRPLLAGAFIASGLEVLANPGPRAKVAKPVVDWVASVVPFAPTDPLAPQVKAALKTLEASAAAGTSGTTSG